MERLHEILIDLPPVSYLHGSKSLLVLENFDIIYIYITAVVISSAFIHYY